MLLVNHYQYLNDYQKYRFAKNIITNLFNTVNGKKISFLGWAFKKDTNDTRESAAIYIADHLIDNMAEIHVYDPKVSEVQIKNDLTYLWGLKGILESDIDQKLNQVFFYDEPYSCVSYAHAVAVITEWDQFKDYHWENFYKSMQKPAFIFDGRNILDKSKLEKIGFKFRGIGKI